MMNGGKMPQPQKRAGERGLKMVFGKSWMKSAQSSLLPVSLRSHLIVNCLDRLLYQVSKLFRLCFNKCIRLQTLLFYFLSSIRLRRICWRYIKMLSLSRKLSRKWMSWTPKKKGFCDFGPGLFFSAPFIIFHLIVNCLDRLLYQVSKLSRGKR